VNVHEEQDQGFRRLAVGTSRPVFRDSNLPACFAAFRAALEKRYVCALDFTDRDGELPPAQAPDAPCVDVQ
jgi:hypothetical protein